MALEGIVSDKRRDVAARIAHRPLRLLEKDVQPSDRSLADALARPHTGFILECKKASPSRGVIREDFDPVAIAKSYAPFADAISVLTDAPYFQGSLGYLHTVRAVVDCPVLCKDFIVDPYQVVEARCFGADAVLLMCSVLSQDELITCLGVASDLRVDALVEVHDEGELERALEAGARVIGVNNRDLKTLRVDLATSERLCPRVPDDRIAVCESGIASRADVRRLRGSCDAFLVGGHLMAAGDLDAAVRELVFGRVKICGLTRVEDARAALDAGATFGGVVLWPESKRAVTVAEAEPLCREVPLAWVGVFVNEDPQRVASAAKRLGLAAVQLHGDEDADYVKALQLPDGCAVWKAERVGSDRPIGDAAAMGVDRILTDRYTADARGGTGERFDWKLFAEHPAHAEMILSGGIAPDNASAADALGPWAIDLSSGVESAPGRKDPDKLAALFAALRGKGKPTC
jgi:indole-3-glycerol phosphate synthase/phosphoribosylanthranilate isomerase